jgi:hypothetical protein
MRELTIEEIKKLANRPNVKRIAVENFLMSMGTDPEAAIKNLLLDAELYNWNRETILALAIRDGIFIAMGIFNDIKDGTEIAS